MKRTVMLLVIVIALLFLVLSNYISLADAASLTFSILAVIFTIVTSFKNELFPFKLSVFTDSLHLVAMELMSNPNKKAVGVLLPITFFNQGYSEGVVEAITLKVKGSKQGTANDFLPAMEVDMVSFVQQGKGLNASNMLGAFVGFLLEPKRALQKFILFTPKVQEGVIPFVWVPDAYLFEIHIKTYGERESKKYIDLKQNITNNSLAQLVNGKANSLFFYSENY